MSSAPRASRLLAVLPIIALSAAPVAAATFTPLGDAAPATYQGSPRALSADGTAVVGIFRDTNQPFRWTAATGFTPIGPANPGYQASAVSADGSVVVGTFTGGAFRWTAATGVTPLNVSLPGGFTLSGATAISSDGSVVAGWAYSPASGEYQAFRWTADTGAVGLGDLPGGITRSLANAISADGSTITGIGFSDSGQAAFRWTAATGIQSLGDLPGNYYPSTTPDLSEGLGISADGSVVVGYATDDTGVRAAFWDGAGNLHPITSGNMSSALAASANGSIVLGGRSYGPSIVWDAAHGTRSLESFLANDYGLGPAIAGWTLEKAYGFSADDSVLIGEGLNPNGDRETFLANLPEPSLLSALLVAPFLARRRRVS
jgi:probable HAF family extracellular repeat protein